jgi:hypothetical protein
MGENQQLWMTSAGHLRRRGSDWCLPGYWQSSAISDAIKQVRDPVDDAPRGSRKSVRHCPLGSYAERRREYSNEEGSFRGAFSDSERILGDVSRLPNPLKLSRSQVESVFWDPLDDFKEYLE